MFIQKTAYKNKSKWKKQNYLHITESLSLKMMPDLNLWILQALEFEKYCIKKNKN